MEGNNSVLMGNSPADSNMADDEYKSSNPSSYFQFNNITSLQFSTEHEFYDYYNMYAKSKGFSIRKDKRRFNKKNILISRIFVFSKEGEREAKYTKNPTRTRKARAVTRFHCPAKLEIKYQHESGKWFVYKFIEEHSHALASQREVAFLRSHRKIDDVAKEDIKAFNNAGIRKSKFMDFKQQEKNGFENIGYITKDLYNYCHRETKKMIELGDAQIVLKHMREREINEPGFFWAYDNDEGGQLSRLFWADEQSRIDYVYFGDVVLFDSTYRTNRYQMPFIPFIGVNNHRATTFFGCGILAKENKESYIWLLRAFLMSNAQKYPKTVVTDGDKAMRKAIKYELPNVSHRWCCWHIKDKLPKILRRKDQRDAFKRLMFVQFTPQQFENAWSKYLKYNRIGKKHRRSKYMHKNKHLWAETFFKGITLLGIRSTQRSESMNAFLHRHLDRNMTLHDMQNHYELCVRKCRMNEAGNDCAATQSIPFVGEHEHPLEHFAATTYTPNIFTSFQYQFEETKNYTIGSKSVVQNYEHSMVIDTINGMEIEIVHRELQSSNSNPNVSCTCMNMESRGIPCRHMLLVMICENFDTIPKSCILSRWKKNARFVLPLNLTTNSMLNESILRYQDLVKFGKKNFLAASKSHSKYAEFKVWFTEAIGTKMKQLEEKHGDDESTEFDNAFYDDDDDDEINAVQNPVISKTKGAPKRPKSYNERRKYTCTKCHKSNHQARTCPSKTGAQSDSDEEQEDHFNTIDFLGLGFN